MQATRTVRTRTFMLVLILVAAILPIITAPPAHAAGPAVFVNEFHYDNSGTDSNETIEIAGPAGTDLTGWSIVLYNGSSGRVYRTNLLSVVLGDDTGSGFGFHVEAYPTNGIQNGSPDGISLVDASGAVVEFFSYEGTFTATEGPAAGMTSTPIPVSEGPGVSALASLQRTGTGSGNADFTWTGPDTNTYGAANTGQTFLPSNAPLTVTCDPTIEVAEGSAASSSATATDADDVATFSGATVTPPTTDISVTITNTASFGGVSNARIDVADTTAPGSYRVDLAAVNALGDTAACVIDVTVTAAVVEVEWVPIYEIQGATHYSPYAGAELGTKGVVTAVAFNGFYVQDAAGDGDDATSDGLFVFVGDGAKPAPGTEVSLIGTISEFIPGGAITGNLSITQMAFPVITELSAGNTLPTPAVIGRGGRVPPATNVIDPSKQPVNLTDPAQAATTPFTPATDGIDFYESLEGMLVEVEDAVAVSGVRTFNSFSSEVFTLANRGKDVEPRKARNRRGGIDLQPSPDNTGDQNPERVQIQFDGTLYPSSVPSIKVGDRLGDVVGVMGYSFGNFEVNAIETVDVNERRLRKERTYLRSSRSRITVATYNVLNLDGTSDDDAQRRNLARQVVRNLRSPDIIALQEIQDNNGTVDDGTTDASVTLRKLRDAIVVAGGPRYAYCDVAPADGTSGGQPGGNIRNAFFWNPDRVKSVEPCRALDPKALAALGVSDPDAFAGARAPLLGVFQYRGERLTLINNHFTSRFGSTPVFGAVQPFVQAGEAEREAQAAAINQVVDTLLAKNRWAKIAVVGDLNTFQWTNDLKKILPGTGRQRVLTNLVNRLRSNVYTFNFEGNSQALDHFFVSRSLKWRTWVDIVHVNVDYPRLDESVASDHEPIVASVRLGHFCWWHRYL